MLYVTFALSIPTPPSPLSIAIREPWFKQHCPNRETPPATYTMTLENDAVAGATIELLETRLRRLTYLLTGDANWTGNPTPPAKPASLDDSVSRRLLRLERDLEKLSRNIPAVRDVLSLRMMTFLMYG